MTRNAIERLLSLLVREKKKGRSGRRSTTTSGAETTDTEIETEISEWEDEPDSRPVDPKIQREIDYLLKHGGTGAARAFLRELERKGAESPTLDPVSASRTPSADHEPHYKLRYPNPVFACKWLQICELSCSNVLF